MQLTITRGTAGNSFDYALPLAEFRFQFRTESDFFLPRFNASMWRGALGHALKRTACVTGARDCGGCLVRDNCAYSCLFETPPPPGADRMCRYNSVPHPLVIRNNPRSGHILPGGELDVDTMLLGTRAVSWLPYLIHALERAGQSGLGRDRVRLSLLRVEQSVAGQPPVRLWDREEGGAIRTDLRLLQPPEAPEDSIRIEFQTPLRLVSQGRVIRAEQFQPVHLWRSLTRRLSMLEYFHGESSREADFKALHRSALALAWMDHQLRDRQWVRYSARQKRRIPLTGVTGWAQLDLQGRTELWPWLWIGQFLHAGKATIMGLGQYRVTGHDKLAVPDPLRVAG